MADSIPFIGTSTPTGPVLPEAFDQFVGDTFFRQMLKSLRATTGKPAFLHGGQAEEIFQSQLDEVIITDMVKATRNSFTGDLFKQQFPHYVPQNQQPPSQTEPNQNQSTESPPRKTLPDQNDNHLDVNA
jgi:hypothetical protein